MNRVKMSYRHRLLLFSKYFLTSFLILLFFSIPVSAGNPNSAQWKNVGGVFLGGEMLLSGNIKFTTSWASNSYSRQKGLYWSGGFWDPADKRHYSPWENTVKNSVAPRIGQITVKGPCNIGLLQRRKGAGIKLLNAETKAGFTPWFNSLTWDVHKNTWNGTVKDINPGGEFWGFIPAPVDGKPVTLDIEAYMSCYDNQGGTGEVSFTAPQEVEYEVWFFPREGGEIIKVIKYGPNGEEIDVTPVQFDEPPPGQIMGGTVEPTLPPDEPITGIPGEVPNVPEIIQYMEVRDIRGDEKYTFDSGYIVGDAKIDYGEFGQKRLKIGDKVRAGDIIVTGNNTTVHFRYTDGLTGGYNFITIEQNSRVKIVTDSLIDKLFKGTYNFAKQAGIKVYNKPALILDAGKAVIHFVAEPFMVLLGIWDERKTDPLPPGSFWGGGVRGTTFRITHNKSTGDKSVAVVEGEVVGGCNLLPETFTSVKAGEKLIVDKDCSGQKTNITTSEIQQIKSLLPDVKKTARRTSIADSYVYAYAYRNWNKANWGKYGSLGAGWHPTGGEKRVFLKFDFSGVDTNSFSSAKLKLFHYHTGGGNNRLSLGVYAITEPWQEGNDTYHSGRKEKTAAAGEISWVNQPSFNLDPIAQFNPGPGTNKFVEVDITPLVMAWLTGKPNYGLMIKPVGIMSGRALESSYGFYSRESKDKSKRPVLVLSGSGSVGQPGEPGGGSGGEVIDHDTGSIRIVSATYGGNCGVAKGNVTSHIARQCDGKSRCRYVVSHKIIGDPAFGCAKTYTVRYRCGNNPQVLERSLPAEAGRGDKAVLLECADSLNEDIVKPDYTDGKVTSKCGLGKRWDVTEVYGWTGVWLRRGKSNVFDALWTLGEKQEKAVLTISIHGNTVNVKRQQSAGYSFAGQECDYKGTLAADNVTVTGTYGCAWSSGPHNWRATIRCDSGGDGDTDTGWQTAQKGPLNSINPKAEQWSNSGGGFMVMNGSHHFDKLWYRRTWGEKDPFYSNGEDTKRPPQHSHAEVMKHAIIKLGKVTVRGPGHLALYGRVKGPGAWVKLYDHGTRRRFHPQTGGAQTMYRSKVWTWKNGGWSGSWSGKWTGNVNDLYGNKPMGGWVPPNKIVTYEIELDQGWYNNMNVPFGSMGFGAPQEIDYELWFFPREGGGIKLEKYPGSASTTGSLPPSQEIKKVITGYGKKK